MTPRETIQAAVDRVQEEGYTIVCKTFYPRDDAAKCMCPLAAVHWTKVGKRVAEHVVEKDVRDILGVDDVWIGSFVDAFDGAVLRDWHNIEASSLGVAFRLLLSPQPYNPDA